MQAKPKVMPLDTKIEMTRIMCYGWCPAYSLVLTADGAVAYHGEHFVKIKGDKSWKIDNSRMEKLISNIQTADYLNIPDIYNTNDGCRGFAFHGPYLKINITINHKTHSIDYYYGCSVDATTIHVKHVKAIQLLSKQIDEACEIEKMIGTEEERKKEHYYDF